MMPMSLKTNSYTCAGLFAGIGGFCIGFEKAGFKTSWVSDLDDRVEETYRRNFPQTKFVREDIAKLDLTQMPSVDVLHAGFPCQSFSAAGNRLGFEDPRGNLFNVMMDQIGDMKVKPRVLVLENSTNIQIGDAGMWFDHIKRRIKKAGFWFNDGNAIIINCATHFGLPQRRERLFMVAVNREFYDYNPFTYVPETESPRGLLEFIRKEKVDDPAYYLDSENRYGSWLLREGGNMLPNQLIQLRQHLVRKQKPDVCPTLTANMGGGGHNVPFLIDDGRLRKLTERECLNLQGFPEEFCFPENLPMSTKYKQIGNSVSPYASFWLAEEIRKFFNEESANVELAV